MSEGSLEYKIGVDDRDSVKLLNFGRNVEATADRIKGAGKNVKPTVELFGSLANMGGGSQFASFAGQIGNLTEKIGQFSEVAKAGGAGALAFKAGLAGAAGVLGFEVGKAIGDVVFETERWNKELERTIALSEQLAAKSVDMFGKGLSRDPTQANLDRLQQDAAGYKHSIESKLAEIENIDDEMWNRHMNIHGSMFYDKVVTSELQLRKNDLEKEIKEAESRLAQIDPVRDAVKKEVETAKETQAKEKQLQVEKELIAARGKSQDYVKSLRDELELLKASDEVKRNLIADRNTATDVDRDRAAGLLQEIEAVKAKAEAEKKAIADKKAADDKAKQERNKEIADQNRLTEIYKDQAAHLEEQIIARQKGQQAADAFALKQKGLTDDAANQMAKVQAIINQADGLQNQKQQAYGDIQARETRLAIGRGNRNVAEMETKRAADGIQQVRNLMAQAVNLLTDIKSKEPVKVEPQE